MNITNIFDDNVTIEDVIKQKYSNPYDAYSRAIQGSSTQTSSSSSTKTENLGYTLNPLVTSVIRRSTAYEEQDSSAKTTNTSSNNTINNTIINKANSEAKSVKKDSITKQEIIPDTITNQQLSAKSNNIETKPSNITLQNWNIDNNDTTFLHNINLAINNLKKQTNNSNNNYNIPNYFENINTDIPFNFNDTIQIKQYLKDRNVNSIKPTKRIQRDASNVVTDFSNNATKFIGDKFTQVVSGLIRKYKKDYGNDDSSEHKTTKNLITKQSLKDINKYPTSKIDTIPMTADNTFAGFSGRTFQPTENHYYAAENINLDEVKLGYRNRGDETPVKSKGIIATTFDIDGSNGKNYKPLTKETAVKPRHNPNNPNGHHNYMRTGYIGVDKDGKFVAGTYNESDATRQKNINRKSIVTETPYIRVTNIPKENGKFVLMSSKGSATRKTVALDADFGDNTKDRISFNVLLGRNNETNLYGDITGGRVIMRVGNETRLASGSMDNIYQVFQDMKKRHKSKYVDFFILDNGTFNKGIRTKNGILDKNTLHMYDRQNTGGGNGLYIK